MATNAVNNDNRGQPKTGTDYGNTVFTNKKTNDTMDQSDFMKLMVAQMQNQDFTNPMDDTQMVDQMVAFSNMQMMQEMAGYSKNNYALSMIGKTVTASRFNVSGDLDTVTGPVQRVSLVDNEFVLYVGGKKYEMGEIMSIGGGKIDGNSAVDPSEMKLTVDGIKSDCATINWKCPTEDELTKKDLKYTVYYSKEGPFTKLEDIKAGTVSGTAETKDITSHDMFNLEPDTTYYVNVVVKDPNGIETIYKTTNFRTRQAGS